MLKILVIFVSNKAKKPTEIKIAEKDLNVGKDAEVNSQSVNQEAKNQNNQGTFVS